MPRVGRVKVENHVGVRGFDIEISVEHTVPINNPYMQKMYFQGRDVNSEGDGGMGLVEMVNKLCEAFLAVVPDHEYIIYEP